MNTPEAKIKLGTERFYSLYAPAAFKYADFVQKQLIVAPEHPLVTSSNRDCFSTVEYDNYLLDQAVKWNKYESDYNSFLGTWDFETDSYLCYIDPENPIISRAKVTEDNVPYLPYYRNNRGFLKEDVVYEANLGKVPVVIVPMGDLVGYAIYGLAGFYLGQESFIDDGVTVKLIRSTPVFAYYDSELPGSMRICFEYKNSLPTSIPEPIRNSFTEMINISQALFTENLKGTRYDAGTTINMGILYCASNSADTEYGTYYIKSTNKPLFTIDSTKTKITFVPEDLPSTRKLPRYELGSARLNAGVVTGRKDINDFSGSPTNYTGVRVSYSTDLSLDIFQPKNPTIIKPWVDSNEVE